ncbi:MAG: pirin family protein [Lysobacteraceae bacterium]|nr:MAG: pirin family protein [Xanthomonadaceae bacterium]
MTTSDTVQVLRRVQGMPVSDGAGVRLRRVIGSPELPDLDPFLLFDEFGTDRPEDYLAGFPDHPHRGFETVTYMLDGRMRHRDNHGNQGLLTPGAVQWMTAGRGLIHSEMPEQEEGRMRGFQLWINLPAQQKMTEPRYQEFARERIPVFRPSDAVTVKVISGEISGIDGATIRGPIEQPATAPLYVDIDLAPSADWSLPLPSGHSAFAYVCDGDVRVGESDRGQSLRAHELGVLGGGERLVLSSGASGARLVVVAGRPLREPVARHGPFVMNTREELMQAFVDYREGRF